MPTYYNNTGEWVRFRYVRVADGPNFLVEVPPGDSIECPVPPAAMQKKAPQLSLFRQGDKKAERVVKGEEERVERFKLLCEYSPRDLASVFDKLGINPAVISEMRRDAAERVAAKTGAEPQPKRGPYSSKERASVLISFADEHADNWSRIRQALKELAKE